MIAVCGFSWFISYVTECHLGCPFQVAGIGRVTSIWKTTASAVGSHLLCIADEAKEPHSSCTFFLLALSWELSE